MHIRSTPSPIPQANRVHKKGFQSLELRQKLDSYQPSAPPCQPLKQYSDNHGRIEHLLLMLSSSYQGEARSQILGCYQQLFEKMEPDTEFTICYQTPADKKDLDRLIAQLDDPQRIHCLAVPPQGDMSIWARDLMVSSVDPSQPNQTIMQDARHVQSSDGNVVRTVAESDPERLQSLEVASLQIEGGNTVSNQRESFIGYAAALQGQLTFQKLTVDNPELKAWMTDFYNREIADPEHPIAQLGKNHYEDLSQRLFEEHFGKKVVVLGKDDPTTPEIERSPAFHVDMVLTPLDDHSLAFADPNLLIKTLAELPPSQRAQAEAQFQELCEQPQTLEQFIQDSAGENVPANFANVERQLEKAGYPADKLVRLPYRLTHSPAYPSFSYNNILQENFQRPDGQEVHRVFLPTSGVEALDQVAIEAYQDQGYQVFPIPMGHVSKQMGELRCITNWLKKSEAV